MDCIVILSCQECDVRTGLLVFKLVWALILSFYCMSTCEKNRKVLFSQCLHNVDMCYTVPRDVTISLSRWVGSVDRLLFVSGETMRLTHCQSRRDKCKPLAWNQFFRPFSSIFHLPKPSCALCSYFRICKRTSQGHCVALYFPVLLIAKSCCIKYEITKREYSAIIYE